MSKYGIFADITGIALALSAAGMAIGLAWTKRAPWAPPEEAVPKGVARLASLGAMIALAAIFVLGKDVLGLQGLLIIAGICFITAVIGLLLSIYLAITRTFTYDNGGRTMGGFKLTQEANRIAKRKRITEQQLFTDAQGDHDLVWTRGSRAAVQIAATVAFLLLILCGTVALTAAAAAAFSGALTGQALG